MQEYILKLSISISKHVIIFRMKALFYILSYEQYIFGKYMYTLSV